MLEEIIRFILRIIMTGIMIVVFYFFYLGVQTWLIQIYKKEKKHTIMDIGGDRWVIYNNTDQSIILDKEDNLLMFDEMEKARLYLHEIIYKDGMIK
jgi:hypothetical protein